MEKISFSKFKKETHHKKVKFEWFKKDGSFVKSFESDKFYCNPYGKNLLSLPRFTMDKNQEWLKLDTKKYQATSDYGHTVFEVIQ